MRTVLSQEYHDQVLRVDARIRGRLIFRDTVATLSGSRWRSSETGGLINYRPGERTNVFILSNLSTLNATLLGQFSAHFENFAELRFTRASGCARFVNYRCCLKPVNACIGSKTAVMSSYNWETSLSEWAANDQECYSQTIQNLTLKRTNLDANFADANISKNREEM